MKCIAIIALLGLTWPLFGQTYVNEFLTLGVGARAHGMGGAVGASAADLSAAYWNPAGLSWIEAPAQFHAMHAEWFAGIAKYDQLAFGKKLNAGHQSFGSLSIIRMGVDNIPNTLRLIGPDGNIDYNRITTFSAADYAAFLSYGRKLGQGNWYIGGSLKVVHRSIGAFGKAWGFGGDIGLQLRREKFMLGIMGRDLTTTFTSWKFSLTEEEKAVFTQTGNVIPETTLEQSLPTIIVAGAYRVGIGQRSHLLVAMDVDITTDGKRNTLIAGDPVSLNPHLGLELDLNRKIFLRTGVSNVQRTQDIIDPEKTNWILQPNAGVGLGLGRLKIDYALTNIGDANGSTLYSHIFTLILNFESPEAGEL